MFVIHFLGKLPNIAVCVCFVYQFEVWFSYQIDYFIGGKKIARVKVKAALSLPNNYLTNRKITNYILAVLQQATLNSPFVVIKYCAVLWNNAHHLF